MSGKQHYVHTHSLSTVEHPNANITLKIRLMVYMCTCIHVRMLTLHVYSHSRGEYTIVASSIAYTHVVIEHRVLLYVCTG